MAGLPQVIIEGNLAADPEMRFVASGSAVASFRVGSTERVMNRETNQWQDGKQCWLTVDCWGQLAENVAETLHRGDRVIVVGSIYDDTYTPNGSDQPRTVTKCRADSVAPSLRNATAQVRRTQRQQGAPAGQQQAPQQDDPWAAQAAQGRAQTSPQQEPQPWGGQQQPAQQAWGQQPPQQTPAQQAWGQAPSYGEPPFAYPPNVISG